LRQDFYPPLLQSIIERSLPHMSLLSYIKSYFLLGRWKSNGKERQTDDQEKNSTLDATLTQSSTEKTDETAVAALAAPTIRPRPIPNSYWATPQLVACEYPWTPKNPNNPKLDPLLRAGVRTFIDLTESGELLPYNDILSERATLLGIDPCSVRYHRFPMRDRCLPDSPAQMYQILDVLRENQAQGRIAAVHCRGGIGRTGMVIGCWLVESGVAKNGEEALSIIAREWKQVAKCKVYPHSPETGPQVDFVFQFHPSTKIRPRWGGPQSM